MFGTDIVYGSTATALRAEGDRRVVTLDDDTEIYARAVVIATGVSYRRLEVPALEALIGVGVFYGAGMSEAQALAGEPVFVVGGGNSAGQAAVHLSRYAERVTLLVRSGSLADSMSQYLISEIAATSNIDIRQRVEVVGGGGEGRLERLELKDRPSGEVEAVPAAALFVLIGAQPFNQWLPSSVIRDQWGYVLTGAQSGAAAQTATGSGAASDSSSSDRRPGAGRIPLLLETNLPGVFAVGDVRQGSVKRVASGAGEGSICIRLVHEYLEAAVDQRH
jgi:thioredoxin reductase (NADPH)